MKATEQYAALKEQNPGTLLLFKIGDFWEFYFEDAVTASRVLGLTLTHRAHSEQSAPMTGFPYHLIDAYLAQLLKAGYRVATCEQVDKSEGAGREVTRIVTPGGLVEPQP